MSETNQKQIECIHELKRLEMMIRERNAQLAEALARIEVLESDLAARRLDTDLIREELHMADLRRPCGLEILPHVKMYIRRGMVEAWTPEMKRRELTLEQIEHALGVILCAYWIAKDGGE